jgi:hypothetical protein
MKKIAFEPSSLRTITVQDDNTVIAFCGDGSPVLVTLPADIPAGMRVDILQWTAAGSVSIRPAEHAHLTPDYVDSSLAIVEATHTFVDLYKVGQVNYLPMTKTTDWRDYTERMTALLQRVGATHYVKRDLQGYLPAGYHNPLRVSQWHDFRNASPIGPTG